MEQEKTTKRGKGEVEDEIQMEKEYFENNKNAKKRGVHGIKEEAVVVLVEQKDMALGVFDFPWLKDGGTSKSDSEDYWLGFEDNFSSSLQQVDASFKAATIEFSKEYEYGLCETPLPHIPETKLEDNAWQTFESDVEAEDVDCIWSSLLNQPI